MNPLNESDLSAIFEAADKSDAADLDKAATLARDACCGQCGECHREEFEIPDRFRREEGNHE